MSTNQTGGDPNPRFHIEGDAAVLETQIQKIEREQREARERETTYAQAQFTINKQQLRVNTLLMVFTGFLLLTSILSGAIAIWEAHIAQQGSAAAQTSAETAQDMFDAVAGPDGQFDRQMRQTIHQTAAQVQSAGAAEKALALHDADRRPYDTCKVLGTMELSYGKIAQANVELINWGQSLAMNVGMDGHIWYGEGILKLVDQYFARLPKYPKIAGSSYLIPKTGEDNPQSPSFKYTTLDSGNQAPSHKAIEFITSHDGGVIVAGRIWYKDTFGNTHWTDFCYRTLQTGAMSNCPQHNEIH